MVFDKNFFYSRRVLFFIFIFFVLFVAVIFQKENIVSLLNTKKTCEDCSVIFVSLDTLSANNLPCYGYERDTSPNLCGFAKKHTWFTNMYTNATFTLPSHVSIFTSLYPFQHGIITTGTTLDPSVDFFPELLQKKGYRTIAVMPKNHAHLPKDTIYNHGIDLFYNEEELKSWREPLATFKDSMDQGKKTFLFLHTYFVHAPYLIDDQPMLYPVKKIAEIPTTHKEVETINADVVDWMRKQMHIRIGPHDISDDDRAKLLKFKELLDKDDVSLQELQKEADALIRYSPNIFDFLFTVPNYYKKYDQENPEHVAFLRSMYDQKIHELDSTLLKDLIDFYDKNKSIRKKLIIVITADHGEEFMSHGELAHETLYNSNTKVPLVIAYPSGKAGQVSDPAQSVDIMPTIMSLLGMTPSAKLQGINLLQKETRGGDRLLVADNTDLSLKSIRWRQWKVFTRFEEGVFTPYEMYNYMIDPNEKNNVLISNTKLAKDIVQKYVDQFGQPTVDGKTEENE